MLQLRTLKYFTAYLLPVLVVISLLSSGFLSYLAVFFSFVMLPILEFAIGKDEANLNEEDKMRAIKNKWFDIVIYFTVPIQLFCLGIFLFKVHHGWPDMFTLIGWITAMGMMCGVFGINVAHELGHRNTIHEKLMAKILLSTSLYMHFYIEHNRGHHRNVGTPADAATARKGESIYRFWLRSVVSSWISAWRIVKKERERKKLGVWSLKNEFIQYMAIQAAILFVLWYFLGWQIAIAFLCAAMMGIFLLESVNYIEHYGLFRNKVNEFRYEDVEPIHSWNSDYILGRLLLFELTRHSDHHWDPAKHYQTLDSMPQSGNLPAGYPAMIVCALFTPLWFSVMDKRIPASMNSTDSL